MEKKLEYKLNDLNYSDLRSILNDIYKRIKKEFKEYEK